MLVDLHRNDVGRVAKIGIGDSVSDVMTVERYSHVMHITSNVTGQFAGRSDGAGRPAREPAGGHGQRSAENPGDADHRRTGAHAPRALWRGRRATSISPATWTPASPCAPSSGATGRFRRPGRRRRRGRFGPGKRIRRDDEQGQGDAQGGGDRPAGILTRVGLGGRALVAAMIVLAV